MYFDSATIIEEVQDDKANEVEKIAFYFLFNKVDKNLENVYNRDKTVKMVRQRFGINGLDKTNIVVVNVCLNYDFIFHNFYTKSKKRKNFS